jgi:predicted transcriptional regulator
MPAKGRGVGNVEVPDALRKVIGEESAINGRSSALDIAKVFGISPSSVSAYDEGATSTATIDVTPNRSHINQAKERVVRRARSKLMVALSNLTPQKIAEAKARDIAGIAKDMAVVIKTMEPESDKSKDNDNRPQFVIFAPQQINENKYETIYVKE